MKTCYIIAGEPSGDFLGASVISAIKKQPEKLNICGVGGKLMEDEGFVSLFDIKEISVGGIVEIVPHILKIKKLIKQTVNDILEKKPDIVLTIDSPGFCFRVAKLVRRRNKNIKLMHLVAPSVWAWRPKRAKKIAKLYDHLLTLFDFEPQYFEKEGLKTTFVGHPAVEDFSISEGEKPEIILLMPGSRAQEIKSLLPIFIESAKKLNAEKIVVPTLPHLIPLVKSLIGSNDISIETDEAAKKTLYKSAKVAIVASGTATLQLALSGCPMVVCYKLSNITYSIIKKMTKVKYISLVNIILNKPVVKELIQKDCNAENIVGAVLKIGDSNQMEEFSRLRIRLTNNGINPSEEIAEIVLRQISQDKS